MKRVVVFIAVMVIVGNAIMIVCLLIRLLLPNASAFENVSATFNADCTTLRITEYRSVGIDRTLPIALTVYDAQVGETVYRIELPAARNIDTTIAFAAPLHVAEVMLYHTFPPSSMPLADYTVALIQLYCPGGSQ